MSWCINVTTVDLLIAYWAASEFGFMNAEFFLQQRLICVVVVDRPEDAVPLSGHVNTEVQRSEVPNCAPATE